MHKTGACTGECERNQFFLQGTFRCYDKVVVGERFFRLPESTYIGTIPYPEAGTTKVDEIWEDLESAGLVPRRILGGVINEWKAIRNRKDKD